MNFNIPLILLTIMLLLSIEDIAGDKIPIQFSKLFKPVTVIMTCGNF